MLCQKCGENDAAVHLTKIINGKKEEVHLCKSCAKKSGDLSFNAAYDYNFQSLLSGVLNNIFTKKNESVLNDINKDKNVCGSCGLSYIDFSKKGLFGCADCYNKFEKNLELLFKRIHGSARHTGKKPSRYFSNKDNMIDINVLKRKMEEAVEKENFEKAAIIRDKIHDIKKNFEEDIDE